MRRERTLLSHRELLWVPDVTSHTDTEWRQQGRFGGVSLMLDTLLLSEVDRNVKEAIFLN